jgi:hypothetical protein
MKTFITTTKYYSEMSDDDLQSEATNPSTSETLNGSLRNSAVESFSNGNH